MHRSKMRQLLIERHSELVNVDTLLLKEPLELTRENVMIRQGASGPG